MKVLRWIAVLPAAIIGSCLIAGLFRLIDRLFNPLYYGDIMSFIDEGAFFCLQGISFVMIGSYVAPEYRRTTSVVLATLGVLFGIVSLCIQLFYIGEFSLKTLVGSICVAIGSVVGSVNIHESENKEDSKQKTL